MKAVLASIEPAARLAVLRKFLDHGGLPPATRNRVEDLIWSTEPWPTIDLRTRREVGQALDRVETFWSDADGLIQLISSLWAEEPSIASFLDGRRGLVEEVKQHLIRNHDWSALELFKELGALNCNDHRFGLFVQGLLSGSVNADENVLRQLAAAVNEALSPAHLRLVETDPIDGYPSFVIQQLGGHARPPRLILFASRAVKPDVRLVDVLDTQIEVLTTTDQVLRYERPIGAAGLGWEDLQTWWAEQKNLTSQDDAKKSLWNRLRAAVVAASSPPQLALFDSYHEIYGKQQNFAALLPEVWLHWDPQTVGQRGDEAFTSQRMDFLMLLTSGRRVVLEVDGQQHYASNGRADPAAYARTVRSDRDLRLSGYEVYRFSSNELASRDAATTTVHHFFDRLFT